MTSGRRKITVLPLNLLLLIFLAVPLKCNTEEELLKLKEEKGLHRIEMVDNDPEFLVGANGMEKPLCFNMEGHPDDVIRLIQDTDSGVVVNARIFFDAFTNKTYLGSILIGRGTFRLVAKQRIVLVNDQRVEWEDVTVRVVNGHRVVVGEDIVAVTFRRRNITLIIRRHFITKGENSDYTDLTGDFDPEDNEAAYETIQNDDTKNTKDEISIIETKSLQRRSLIIKNFFNQHKNMALSKNVNIQINPNNEEELKRIYWKKTQYINRPLEREEQMSLSDGPKNVREHPRRHHRHRVARHNKDNNNNEDEKYRNKTIFLGIHIADARGLSENTHGLLGQFLFKNVTLEKIRYKNGRMKGRLLVNNDPHRRTLALLSLRKNLVQNITSACWRVRQHGKNVLDGNYTDYLVPNIRFMNPKLLPPSSPL